MTLTPEQLEEARQLLGIPNHSGGIEAIPPATADNTEGTATAESDQKVTDTPAPAVDTAPAVSADTLSVYCPNCSHLLAKVSNDAN